MKQTTGGVLQATRQILESFRLNWKSFLAIHIAVNIFSFVVLTPLATLLIGWLILASGQTALKDEDILLFALSPSGSLVMLLVAALYTTVVIFQQATMITVSYKLTSGQPISLANAGRYMLGRIWPLFQLALHMIARTVLITAPFLAVSTLIFYAFLTEFDINYYLANKPPVFWWAGALILLCLLSMTGFLLRIFSGWVLALPLLLINGNKPSGVLQKSRKATVSLRFPISVTLLVLFLLNTGMLAAVSSLADLGVDGVVALAGDSLHMMAYLLGGMLVVWVLANMAITFFANSVLSLIILYMFTRLVGASADSNADETPVLPRSTRSFRFSVASLAALALSVGLAAGLAISLTMKRLDLEDHTMIIAHRGASADAPENTLAAMELAITEGADWVEIDVQETREGEVVVIHDGDLKKIGDSDLRVFEASLEELQSVDIGSWMDPSFSDQRVPSLQQLLALCKNRINVVIELKYYGREERLEERVVNIVEAAGMQDQIVVMSLSYAGIQKIKSIRPEWKVGLLSSVAMGDITRLEADFFAINARFASRAFIRQAHKRDRQVMVWTVNDPISMSAMMSKGVNGIITDKPGLASSIRKERAELDIHERMLIQLASFIGKQPIRPQQ